MPEEVTELVDAGQAAVRVWTDKIDQLFCGRAKCDRVPEVGHDFCPPCLAWLRSEIDDDPVLSEQPEQPPPAVLPAIPAEGDTAAWYEYVVAATSGGGWF